MNIDISKKEIFNEVEKRSSLEGYVIPDQYDKVWANERRGELLNSYWIEGYNIVIQLLKKHLSNSTVEYSINNYDDDEVVSIEVDMPKRYNSLLDGSVVTSAKMLIACNILYKWIETHIPDRAAKYQTESSGYASLLVGYITSRKEPVSILISAKSDDEELIQGWGKCCYRDKMCCNN